MKRVGVVFLMIAACILTVSVAVAWEEEGDDQLQTIHVAGKVLCQDCTQGWNEWVDGAKPINGSKVSVTCLDERSRIVYYGSDLTDNIGNFEIIIKKYNYGKEIKPNHCFLRLVSSPDPVCNLLTDFSGGKSGVKLGGPTMVYRDIVKYVAGPFYYTTPMCDEPDDNDDDKQDGVDDSEDANDRKY